MKYPVERIGTNLWPATGRAENFNGRRRPTTFHGNRKYSDFPGYRCQQSAEPSACRMEAHRRSRHLHSALWHRRKMGVATLSRFRAPGALHAERHMYEEIYYVVEGRGSTEVWLDSDKKRHTFEWQAGSLFSIPFNAWHRIVNASSSPALLLGGTTAPNVMNLINNTDAIFNCPYEFRDRSAALTTFSRPRTILSPIRCAALRCGAPISFPTSSTASCRSTIAVRRDTAASSRS